MAETILDQSKTMLLMADFTTSGIGQNPIARELPVMVAGHDVRFGGIAKLHFLGKLFKVRVIRASFKK